MARQTRDTILRIKYDGREVHIWHADGVWHYQAALSAAAPLPAVGASGYATVGQATNAAMAFIDGASDAAPTLH